MHLQYVLVQEVCSVAIKYGSYLSIQPQTAHQTRLSLVKNIHRLYIYDLVGSHRLYIYALAGSHRLYIYALAGSHRLYIYALAGSHRLYIYALIGHDYICWQKKPHCSMDNHSPAFYLESWGRGGVTPLYNFIGTEAQAVSAYTYAFSCFLLPFFCCNQSRYPDLTTEHTTAHAYYMKRLLFRLRVDHVDRSCSSFLQRYDKT